MFNVQTTFRLAIPRHIVSRIILGLLFTPTLFAQVELTPGFIEGEVRFTNTNPNVLTILDDIQILGCFVAATSTDPSGFSSRVNCTTNAVSPSYSKDYQTTVESDGGQGAVTYRLISEATLYAADNEFGVFRFPNTNDIVVPINQTVESDITDCAQILDFRFGANCADGERRVGGVLIGTANGRRALKRVDQPIDQTFFVGRGTGDDYNLNVNYSFGSGAEQLRFSETLRISPQCDAITPVDLDTPCSDADGDPGMDDGGVDDSELGVIAGQWDIVGEFEHSGPNLSNIRNVTRISGRGPSGNVRNAIIPGDENLESSTLSQADWSINRLVPGNWSFSGNSVFRKGRAFTVFRPAAITNVNVTKGSMENIGDTFVMTPGRFFGDIRLVDPFPLNNPGARSGLQDLTFAATGDALPNNLQNNLSGIFALTSRGSVPSNCSGDLVGRADSGCSNTAWPFDLNGTNSMSEYDPAAGEFRSNYDLIVANPNNETQSWVAQNMRLSFLRQEGPVRGFGNIIVQDLLAPTVDVSPNSAHEQNFSYCFSDINITYSTASGTIFRPEARIGPQTGAAATMDGADFEETQVLYNVGGRFFGQPLQESDAAPVGNVLLTLPQGSYNVSPLMRFVPDGDGNPVTISFPPLPANAGCGQRINATPTLSISTTAPNCADENGDVMISGNVSSGDDAVTRIWYRLNNGPEIDICASDCGTSPAYSATVRVNQGENSLQVFATSEPNADEASVITSITYDDPRDGEIFGNGSCAIARCDLDGDGDIDRVDINQLFAMRGQPGFNGFDVNEDGVLSVNDGRACVRECTRPRCATE